MKSIIDELSPKECEILERILKNQGSRPADFFFDDPTIDGRVEVLTKLKLVEHNPEGLFITELGRSTLVDYKEQSEKEIARQLKQDKIGRAHV